MISLLVAIRDILVLAIMGWLGITEAPKDDKSDREPPKSHQALILHR